MVKRTTIESDAELLARARRALGSSTTRATVEEALRIGAEAAELEWSARANAGVRYLGRLGKTADLEVLRSGDMWK